MLSYTDIDKLKKVITMTNFKQPKESPEAKQARKRKESLTKSLERRKSSTLSKKNSKNVLEKQATELKKKEPKQRSCKTCLMPLHVNRIGQLCQPCAKTALKAKQVAKKEKYGRTIKGRKALKKKAEELLHLYIRRRAMDFDGTVECYTCRKRFPFEKVQAGHFRHGKLDLDQRNLKPQCGFSCNYNLSGNLGKYAIRLTEDNGAEWVKQLDQDADRDTGQYSYEFLLSQIEHFKLLLTQL